MSATEFLELGKLEISISVDEEGNITSWNKATEIVTSYSKKQFLYKNIFDDSIPDTISVLFNPIKESIEKKKIVTKRLHITDRCGNHLDLDITTSIIKDEKGNPEGAVLKGREFSGSSSIFVPGISYISFNVPLEDILNRVCEDYKLVHLTRNPDKGTVIEADHKVLFSNKYCEGYRSGSKPNSVIDILYQLSNGSRLFIIFDRSDYLYVRYGFYELMKFIYALNDLVVSGRHIAVINTRKDLFKEKEQMYLEDELEPLPGHQFHEIDGKKRSLLQIIENKNVLHIPINFTTVSDMMGISRMTAYRWLRELQNSKLIRTVKNGRNNNILITDKGRQFLKSINQ